jgi:hypothetical protein
MELMTRGRILTLPPKPVGRDSVEPTGSPKFQDSSFKPGSCFKLETDSFKLRGGS